MLILAEDGEPGDIGPPGIAGLNGSGASGANPSASVGLSAINGSATTFMRSDGAPALSQAIVPTWTGAHTFSYTGGAPITVNNAFGRSGILVNSGSGSTGAQADIQITRTSSTQGAGNEPWLEFYDSGAGAAAAVAGSHYTSGGGVSSLDLWLYSGNAWVNRAQLADNGFTVAPKTVGVNTGLYVYGGDITAARNTTEGILYLGSSGTYNIASCPTQSLAYGSILCEGATGGYVGYVAQDGGQNMALLSAPAAAGLYSTLLSKWLIYGTGSNTYMGTLSPSATAGSQVEYYSGNVVGIYTSNAKYKADIEDVDEDTLERLLNVRPRRYHSLETDPGHIPGHWWYAAVAEEVEQIVPELCIHRRKHEPSDDLTGANPRILDEKEMVGIQYDKFGLMLVPIVRRQRDMIAALTARIATLEAAHH